MNHNPQSSSVEQIQDMLAETLQVPRQEITPDLSFGDLPQWDSMGHMEVMMRLEELYGIEINAETIAQLTSIPAIYAALAQQNPSERRHA